MTNRPTCSGCGMEIDPELCHCGDRVDAHTAYDHSPMPVGCVCGYATAPDNIPDDAP